MRRAIVNHDVGLAFATTACLLWAVTGAGAQDVAVGVDAYRLSQSSPTVLDFSLAPIPADFFVPGTDPFEGSVAMEYYSFEIGQDGPRVRRITPGVFSAGSTAVVQMEAAPMMLQSQGAITIPSGYGPLFYYVYVTLEATPVSTGQLGLERAADGLGGIIRRDLPGGGDVDSFFDITYRIEFVETCGCSYLSMPPVTERLELDAEVPWSYAPPVGVALDVEASNFFAGATPGEPDAEPVELVFTGQRLHLALELQDAPSPPSILGDADIDGDVDLDDFVILKTNFGMTSGATWGMGDFDGDGDVDLDDFVILKSNFGAAGS